MTVAIFLIILTMCSAITSLLTEGIKNLLKGKQYSVNILVLIIAFVCGVVVCTMYYISNQIPFTFINICYIVAMAIANWLCATLGYDKVLQTINQIKGV